MNIHILGIPHSVTSRKFLSCPFTQGIYNFLVMMENETSINSIKHYGHPASELPDYVENIPVIDDDLLMESYGYYSATEDFPSVFDYDINDSAYINFNRRTIPLIRNNVERGDLVLFTMGKGHELIYKALQPIEEENPCIEYRIGYYNTLVDYFHIYSTHGHRIAMEKDRGTYDNPLKFSDRVISWGPNPDDFTFNDKKEDYFLFLGRLVEGKGIDLCIQLANIKGLNLKIAGPGNLQDLEYDVENLPENIEIIGPVGVEERATLLSNAKGLLAPSIYYESLGWQVIEALLSGTPVISTDFGGFTETTLHGVTGFRCNTFKEFLDSVDKIDDINNQECYDFAFNKFNYDIVKNKYLNYFSFITGVIDGSGFYEGI